MKIRNIIFIAVALFILCPVFVHADVVSVAYSHSGGYNDITAFVDANDNDGMNSCVIVDGSYTLATPNTTIINIPGFYHIDHGGSYNFAQLVPSGVLLSGNFYQQTGDNGSGGCNSPINSVPYSVFFGCTDPDYEEYNAAATYDDGSCATRIYHVDTTTNVDNSGGGTAVAADFDFNFYDGVSTTTYSAGASYNLPVDYGNSWSTISTTSLPYLITLSPDCSGTSITTDHSCSVQYTFIQAR